ncbi:TonB-dependent receptor [Neptunitalea lumnitzerae]|uniref:TonB-dependent receptor n=1 Tax=Neptunitalea lumnitzerae TaxID=2965509 RepID=A0ABQ5MHP6_9FLAO|nr:TonB-dependent receptor [Neptunitalea sp. Y10]GLB48560.1 TonB-dependent receptor [Neptunitalea sp. Y10]
MRNVLAIVFLLLGVYSASAQSGKITGNVQDEKMQMPIVYANVTLVNTAIGATTDVNGDFTLNNVPVGSYKLKITAIGYTSFSQSIEVSANETVTIGTVNLKEDTEVLNEVVVQNSRANKFTKEKSVTVAKMDLKDIENPQVYNVISSTVLEEQIVTNFDDALKNAPGIDKLWESTGRGSDGAGYYSLRGFSVQPTMVNGLPALTNGSPDPANIESIEVIKGPSGTLFGSSLISYGGLINLNTKQPFYGYKGQVSYTGGSYGLNRVTADVNALLSDEKQIAMRVNTAYHTQNSFQDAGFRKSFFVAPSLAYQVNDKLSFHINTEFYTGKSTNQTMLFLDRGTELRVHNLDELGYDHKRSYTSNDLYIETPSYSLQGQMRYKINDQWTSQTAYSRSSAKSEGIYSYIYEITRYTPMTEGVVFQRYFNDQNSETLGTDIQQNFIGEFNIGSVKNKMVVGLDYFNQTVINNGSGYVSNGMIYIGDDLAGFNQNVLGVTDASQYTDDTGVLTHAGSYALLANTSANISKSSQEIYSAYASDVVYILPQLSAMASLRVDHFSNDEYNQTVLSPKFGIVYQPILDKVSLFANYMDGFSNVGFASDQIEGQEVVRSFDPEHATQLEFGTKLNLLDGKLAATFSYYDINVKDMVYSITQDAVDPNIAYNTINLQNGEQESKGFEASVIANPFKGFNIIAGYSYNDSKLVEGDADFMGRRPESAGPQNLANLWASYKFTGGTLNGFGLGFGGNYASENKIFNRNLGGTFALDSYTVLNASVFYGNEDFRLGLKLDNIANKEYYKGWSTISPQMLRSISANFTYMF